MNLPELCAPHYYVDIRSPLPRLIASPDNMLSADLVVAIGKACFERMLSKAGGPAKVKATELSQGVSAS